MASKEWKENNQDKMREYRRDYYQRNKESEKARISARSKELKQWMRSLKSTLSCSTCGENHPYCLEFHHLDSGEKDMAVSQAIVNGWSKERVLDEISKCQVLCANCHRKVHHPIEE